MAEATVCLFCQRLGVLEHCAPTAMMIYPWDRDALSYLIDIRCTNVLEPPAFNLDFVFASNPYFTNSTLTGQFEFRKTNADELSGSAEYYSPWTSAGATIDWFTGQDLTKWTKQVKNCNGDPETMICIKRSFFNFFAPLVTNNLDLCEDFSVNTGADLKKQCQTAFELDFHIANCIRTKLIPNAVEFYLGSSKDSAFATAGKPGQHPSRKAAHSDRNRLVDRGRARINRGRLDEKRRHQSDKQNE